MQEFEKTILKIQFKIRFRIRETELSIKD